MPVAVSAIIVAYDNPEDVVRAVGSLHEQTLAPTEIIVVDNHEAGAGYAAVKDMPGVLAVRAPHNSGYTGGAALGAARATGEHLLFLNPDAVAAPDCLEQLTAEMSVHPQAAVVGAQILLPDGMVNAGDNPLHIIGLSWAGRYGQAPENGPARQVLCASGAALLIRARVYRQLSGFTKRFFLYCDDTDFCWRARLAGYEVWLCPRALAQHDYEFSKGAEKWRYLERNRLWMVLANYRVQTLILLAPLLLACEAGLLLVAVRGGWGRQKLGAWRDIVHGLGWLREQRRSVRRQRRVTDGELLGMMSGCVDTPVLNGPLVDAINPVLTRYRQLLQRLVR